MSSRARARTRACRSAPVSVLIRWWCANHDTLSDQLHQLHTHARTENRKHPAKPIPTHRGHVRTRSSSDYRRRQPLTQDYTFPPVCVCVCVHISHAPTHQIFSTRPLRDHRSVRSGLGDIYFKVDSVEFTHRTARKFFLSPAARVATVCAADALNSASILRSAPLHSMHSTT